MQRLAQQCISLCPRTRRSPRWWLHGEGCSEREEPLHMKVLTGTWNLPEQGQGWALRQLRNCLLGQTEHWACKSLLLWTLFRFIFFEVNIWYEKKKKILALLTCIKATFIWRREIKLCTQQRNILLLRAIIPDSFQNQASHFALPLCHLHFILDPEFFSAPIFPASINLLQTLPVTVTFV